MLQLPLELPTGIRNSKSTGNCSLVLLPSIAAEVSISVALPQSLPLCQIYYSYNSRIILTSFSSKFFFLILTEGYAFIDFREKEEVQQRERETDTDGLPSVHDLTRDQTCNLGVCPDWQSNRLTFGVWGQRSNQLSHPARAHFHFYYFFSLLGS